MKHFFCVVFTLLFLITKANDSLLNETATKKPSIRLSDNVPENNPATKETSSVVLQKKEKRHSPTLALWLSLVPGGGQIYNKKYWKLPIIYGLGYFLYYKANENNKELSIYLASLKAKRDNPAILTENQQIEKENQDAIALDPNATLKPVKPLLIDEYPGSSAESVNRNANSIQNDRDLFYALLGITLIANMIDAFVDAHFFTYSINDDLSFAIKPYSNFSRDNFSFKTTPITGFSLQISIK